MADAEDLKSSGDFSSCGFDSHPGHQSVFHVYAASWWVFFSLELELQPDPIDAKTTQSESAKRRGVLDFVP
jgi:hypothetical protein